MWGYPHLRKPSSIIPASVKLLKADRDCLGLGVSANLEITVEMSNECWGQILIG